MSALNNGSARSSATNIRKEGPIHDLKEDVLLDFYKGAYGPTIRIATHSPVHLIAIRELFLRLGSGEQTTASFEKSLSTTRLGIQSLELRVTPKRLQNVQTIAERGREDGKPLITWSLAKDEWNVCASLVDGLIRLQEPGHQYMSREDTDDIVIELSFRE